MNTWQIRYVWNGNYETLINADTVVLALEKFRCGRPEIPIVAVYSVECVR